MLKIHVILPADQHLTFEVPPEETTSYLIDKIKQDKTVTIPNNKILTLIYRGKILTGKEVLSRFDSMMEFTIQGFYRNDPNAPEKEQVVVNDLRGFDRLARMNYSQEQIQEIRESFHQTHHTEDGSEQSRIDLEEEWFPVLFNQRDIGSMIRANLPNLHNFEIPQQTQAPQNEDEQAVVEVMQDRNNQRNNERGNERNNGRNLNQRLRNSPLIRNEIETIDEPSPDVFPGQNFVFGFLFGIFFGAASILLALIDYQRYSFIVGLACGAIINIILSTY